MKLGLKAGIFILAILVCSGCQMTYYGMNQVVASMAPLNKPSWSVRLQGDTMGGAFWAEGGFIDSPKEIPYRTSRLWEGKSGELFKAETPLVITDYRGGQWYTVTLPLQEILKKPIQGVFTLKIDSKKVSLSIQELTGKKLWSPGTGMVSQELGVEQLIVEEVWVLKNQESMKNESKDK